MFSGRKSSKAFQSISVPKAGPTLKEIPLEPLGIAELISGQAGDEICRSMLENCRVSEDERGLLVRVSPLDVAQQVLVPEKLKPRCLALLHLPRVSGHAGSTKMYDQMRRVVYWPRIAADVSDYVSRCPSCAKKSLRVGRKTPNCHYFLLPLLWSLWQWIS
jgi:Integrase zinc binding domain